MYVPNTVCQFSLMCIEKHRHNGKKQSTACFYINVKMCAKFKLVKWPCWIQAEKQIESALFVSKWPWDVLTMVPKKGMFELSSFTLEFTLWLHEQTARNAFHCIQDALSSGSSATQVRMFLQRCFSLLRWCVAADKLVSGHVIFTLLFRYPKRKKVLGSSQGSGLHTLQPRAWWWHGCWIHCQYILCFLWKKEGLTICFRSVHRYVGLFVVFFHTFVDLKYRALPICFSVWIQHGHFNSLNFSAHFCIFVKMCGTLLFVIISMFFNTRLRKLADFVRHIHTWLWSIFVELAQNLTEL